VGFSWDSVGFKIRMIRALIHLSTKSMVVSAGFWILCHTWTMMLDPDATDDEIEAELASHMHVVPVGSHVFFVFE
jgi:hypothetical protein